MRQTRARGRGPDARLTKALEPEQGNHVAAATLTPLPRRDSGAGGASDGSCSQTTGRSWRGARETTRGFGKHRSSDVWPQTQRNQGDAGPAEETGPRGHVLGRHLKHKSRQDTGGVDGGQPGAAHPGAALEPRAHHRLAAAAQAGQPPAPQFPSVRWG